MTHSRKVWITVAVIVLSATLGVASRTPAWWSPRVLLTSFDSVWKLATGGGVLLFLVVIPTVVHSYDVVRGIKARIRGAGLWAPGWPRMVLDVALTLAAIALILAPLVFLLRTALAGS